MESFVRGKSVQATFAQLRRMLLLRAELHDDVHVIAINPRWAETEHERRTQLAQVRKGCTSISEARILDFFSHDHLHKKDSGSTIIRVENIHFDVQESVLIVRWCILL